MPSHAISRLVLALQVLVSYPGFRFLNATKSHDLFLVLLIWALRFGFSFFFFFLLLIDGSSCYLIFLPCPLFV